MPNPDSFEFDFEDPSIRATGSTLNKDEQGNVTSAEAGLTNSPEPQETSQDGSILPIEIKAPDGVIEGLKSVLDVAQQAGSGAAEGLADLARNVSTPVRAVGAALEAGIEATATGADFQESFDENFNQYPAEVKELIENVLPESDNPISGVVRKLAELGTAAGSLPSLGTGAIAPIVKFEAGNLLSVDAAESNLSSVAESIPLIGDLFNKLAAHEGDTQTETAIKHAIEDALLLGVGKVAASSVEGLQKSLKALAKAKKSVSPEVQSKVFNESLSTSEILDDLVQPASGKIKEANRNFKPKTLTEGQRGRVNNDGLSPVLFRESNAENLIELLEGIQHRPFHTGPHQRYFSNTKNLAIGQGENKGIQFSTTFDNLNITENLSKPALGGVKRDKEFIASFKTGDKLPISNLKSVSIDTKLVNINTGFGKRLINTLERSGFKTAQTSNRLEFTKTPKMVESKFLNVARLDTNDIVKARLAQTSKEMMKYLKKKGIGKRMTGKSVMKSAKYYTKKDNYLKFEKQFIEKGVGDISDPNIQGKLLALREMMLTRAEEIVKIKERVAVEGESDLLTAALKRAEDAEEALMQVDKVISTNLGRGLSFRGIFAQARKKGIPDNEVLAAYKATDGDLNAVEDIITRSNADNVVDIITEVTINNMFSVATMTLNGGTAFVNTIVNPVLRVLGGAVGGDKEEVLKGLATYQGIVSQAAMSLKMGAKSFIREDAILDAGGQAFKLNKSKVISAERFNLQATKRGVVIDAVGNLVRVPSRVLNATDEFSKQLNYRAMVYSDAWYEGMQKGLKGDKLASFIETEVKMSIGQAGEGVNPKALDWARENTFTKALDPKTSFVGATAEGVNAISNAKNPIVRMVGKHVFPFVRVPFNILDQSIDLTPALNLMRRRTWDDLKGVNGPTAKAMRLGRIITSQQIGTVAYDLQKKGILTGSSKREFTQQDNLKGLNHPTNSIKIGGEWHPLERFEPWSTPLLFMANVADMSDELDEKTMTEMVTSFTVLLEDSLQSKRYLQNLTDLIALATEEDEDRLDSKWERFFQKKAVLGVPGTVRFVNNDPYYREMYDYQQAVMNRLGMGDGSENRPPLDPHRNMFGEPRLKNRFFDYDEFNDVLSFESMSNAAFDYFGTQTAETSPLEDELARLITDSDARFSIQPRQYQNLDLAMYKNEQGQSSLDRMKELLGSYTMTNPSSPYQGKTLKQAMNKLMKSREYQEASDAIVGSEAYGTLVKGTKKQMMQDLYSEFKMGAREQVLGTKRNVFGMSEKDFKPQPDGEGMLFVNDTGESLGLARFRNYQNEENVSTPISKLSPDSALQRLVSQ